MTATRWHSSSNTRRASGRAAPRHAAFLRRPGGYFGYDTVRHIEPCLGPAVKPFPAGMEGGTPDLMLMHVDELVIVDNLAGRIYLMVYADPAQPEAYSRAQQRLHDLRARLRRRWKSRTATPACRPRNDAISRRKTIWRPCTAPRNTSPPAI